MTRTPERIAAPHTEPMTLQAIGAWLQANLRDKRVQFDQETQSISLDSRPTDFIPAKPVTP